MRFLSITLLLAAVGILNGCSTRGIDRDVKNGVWTLVRMELDETHIQNRGYLPMFMRPTGASGMGIPRARGQLQSSDLGRVTCDVRAYEPTVGLGGRVSATQVDLIRFYGHVSRDGTLFLMEDPPTTAPLGTATRLHVESAGKGYLKIQAATGNTKLPYIYYFKAGARPPEPINVPYFDG